MTREELNLIEKYQDKAIWTCEYMTFGNEKWHTRKNKTIKEALEYKNVLMNKEVPLTLELIDKMKKEGFDDSYIDACIEGGMCSEYQYFEIFNDDLNVRIMTDDCCNITKNVA